MQIFTLQVDQKTEELNILTQSKSELAQQLEESNSKVTSLSQSLSVKEESYKQLVSQHQNQVRKEIISWHQHATFLKHDYV